MAEVYKIMQVSNSISGYKAGDRVYVGYITENGEFVESQKKTNLRTGKAVRTAGYTETIRKAGNLRRNSESKKNRNARKAVQRTYR